MHRKICEWLVCSADSTLAEENYESQRCCHLVLVTSNFHMQRSRQIFETVFGAIDVSVDSNSNSRGPSGTSETAAAWRFSLEFVPAADGEESALLRQTGKTLAQWRSEEAEQLANKSGDSPPILWGRLEAHEKLAVAAKTSNIGALDAWLRMHGQTDGSPPSVDNEKSRGGSTALHYAALCGSEQILDRLLAVGADPNLQNDLGATPLHMAALRAEPLRSIL
eukprot:SAG31_NODE_6588_length_1961_cov_2.769603_1_plen_221_part_10